MTQAPKVLNDAKLQRYYDSLFEMHGTEGWREMMADIEYMETEQNRLDKVKTAEEMHFRQGELNQIRWLKTHKDRTEAAYAHMLDEQEGEGSADAPTGGVAKVVA